MPATADQYNCLFKLQSRALLSCCSQESCRQSRVKRGAVKLQSMALLSMCSQDHCCQTAVKRGRCQNAVKSAAVKLQSRALLSNCGQQSYCQTAAKSTGVPCIQEHSCFLQCVGVWGVGLGARRPDPCWWPLPALLRLTSWASKCGSATTATLTSGRMEVRACQRC